MVVRLPLKDGREWQMPPEFEKLLMEQYFDVPTEMRKAMIWLEANPQRRKTLRGIRQFCVNWLNNAGKLRPATAPQNSLSIQRVERSDKTAMPQHVKDMINQLKRKQGAI
jgi:hypothetical protein